MQAVVPQSQEGWQLPTDKPVRQSASYDCLESFPFLFCTPAPLCHVASINLV